MTPVVRMHLHSRQHLLNRVGEEEISSDTTSVIEAAREVAAPQHQISCLKYLSSLLTGFLSKSLSQDSSIAGTDFD